MTGTKLFQCLACKRTFEATQEDVDLAAGHLCLAADRGLSQREALEEMKGAASQPEAGKERSEVR